MTVVLIFREIEQNVNYATEYKSFLYSTYLKIKSTKYLVQINQHQRSSLLASKFLQKWQSQVRKRNQHLCLKLRTFQEIQESASNGGSVFLFNDCSNHLPTQVSSQSCSRRQLYLSPHALNMLFQTPIKLKSRKRKERHYLEGTPKRLLWVGE